MFLSRSRIVSRRTGAKISPTSTISLSRPISTHSPPPDSPFVSDDLHDISLDSVSTTASASILVDQAPLIPFADIPLTFFQPLSSILLSSPPSIGLSYAMFLPLFTLGLRGALTLPLMLWQRGRTRKFADVVMPEIRKAQEKARFDVRAECRRAGKSFEQYQEAFKIRVRLLVSRDGVTSLIRFHRRGKKHLDYRLSTSVDRS